MKSRTRIQPGEQVDLTLTATERELILNEVMFLDEEYEDRLRSTPTSKPIMLTLDEADDFGGYIAAEANHCDDKKKQKNLDTIFQKIQRLLSTYTDEDDSVVSLEEARRKMGKAMADLLGGEEPGVGSFRLPTPKKQLNEKYPIKTTPHQREALVSCTQLKAAIKRRLKEASDGTQVVEFTKKELDHMLDELGQAAVYAPSPYKKRVMAVQKKVTDILDELQLQELGIQRPKSRTRPTSKSDRLYQFKITLLKSQPPIWRRIQVKNCTLDKLHEHIQTAMGWENSHLHQFEIDGERYGIPEYLDGGFDDFHCIDSSGIKIAEVVPQEGTRFPFVYKYDFGDGWKHEVLFEGCLRAEKGRRYPLCVEGERACPPEDVGGVWGYAEFLEAIANPKHEQHEDFMEWAGDFDPEKFDAEQTTKAMRRGMRDWRGR